MVCRRCAGIERMLDEKRPCERCFPDVGNMVVAATAKAHRYFGVVYPRNWLVARSFLSIGNIIFKLRGNPFHALVHKPGHIDELICGAGF